MAITDFPSIETSDESGLVAVGGDMEIDSLKLAYRRGIFPWPISEDYPLAWFSPDPRGVIDFKDLKISSSLKKAIARNKIEVRFNTRFLEVIEACSSLENRKDQDATWITAEIVQAYISFHNAGYAYSAEAYNVETGLLVGGVYGVIVGGYASGESMFYRESNASKIALVKLLQKLNEHGIDWLDTQMVTPVVSALGGKEISRHDFIKRIEKEKIVNFYEVFS